MRSIGLTCALCAQSPCSGVLAKSGNQIANAMFRSNIVGEAFLGLSMVVLRGPSSETVGAQTSWLPNSKGLGNRPSQRSLHNAPIFRLLLKVAVKGTHQCDLSNFCGGFWPPTFEQRIAKIPRVGVEAGRFAMAGRRPLCPRVQLHLLQASAHARVLFVHVRGKCPLAAM